MKFLVDAQLPRPLRQLIQDMTALDNNRGLSLMSLSGLG